MFIEIPPCSPDHIRRGSVPRFTTDVRFRGFVASHLGYFRNGPQWLVLDLQYSTFRY